MAAADVQLSVVVASIGRADVARAVESVRRSAAAAGVPAEIVVVWQADDPAPALPADVVIDVFPVGLSYARNRGAAAARAPLVAFVDDDEVVDVGWVPAIVTAFADHPDVEGVFGTVAPLDDEGIPYCEVSGASPQVHRRPSTPPWVVGTGGNMAFRRATLCEIGGFDVRLGAGAPGRAGEESDLIVRMLRSGRPLLFHPDATVLHPTKSAAEHLASRRPYGHGAGAVARRRRDVGLAARYTVALMQSMAAGIRAHDPQRRREAMRTGAGFLGGLVTTGRTAASPATLPRRPPAELAAVLAGRSLRPRRARYAPHPELRYDAGPLRLRILPGSPCVAADPSWVASAVHRDALWVVERRRRR